MGQMGPNLDMEMQSKMNKVRGILELQNKDGSVETQGNNRDIQDIPLEVFEFFCMIQFNRFVQISILFPFYF